MASGDTEMLLQQAEAATFDDVGEAMATLTSLGISINHEIESAGSDAFVTDGVGDKLREWIRRLVALIKKVATEWGAIHYSIGVSLEGLSLSVEWAGPKGN
jgi:hypothetical protein